MEKPSQEGKHPGKQPGLIRAGLNPVLYGLPWLHPNTSGPVLGNVACLQKSSLPSKKNQVIWRALRQ